MPTVLKQLYELSCGNTSWLAKEELPSVPKMLVAHSKIPNVTADQLEKEIYEGYTNHFIECIL